MNTLALVTLAGVVCLPATYTLTREGSLVISVLIVALVGAIAGGMSVVLRADKTAPRNGSLALALVGGAAVSEMGAFVHYYITDGYQDPKLGVGVAVSVIEFSVIAVVGCVALLIAASVTQSRRTSRSKGRAASGAPMN